MSSLPGGDETSSRKGSFAPNEPASGQPVQLRFDQFDTAIRDPSKPRSQAIAQAQRRQQPTTFSRDWWTKPKIVVAAIVLALLLILIIVLPIVLTLGRSSTDSLDDSNSTTLGFNSSSLDFDGINNITITDLINAVLNDGNLSIFILPETTKQPIVEAPITTAPLLALGLAEDANATTVILSDKTTVPPLPSEAPPTTPNATTASTTTTTTTTTTAKPTTVGPTAANTTAATSATTLPPTTNRTTAATNTPTPIPLPTIKRPPLANCTGFGFRCTSDPNIVIGTNKVCDGRRDCADGSDEAQCKECQTTFSCPSGKDSDLQICLRGDTLCDGTRHCPTGLDEQLHCKTECQPNEYKCEGPNAPGKLAVCLPKTYLCDGDAHCKFEDDETNCQPDSCQGGSRWCEADRRCIAEWHICDGISHCSDNSDEIGCDCRACSGSDVALCSSNGPLARCVSRDRVCDGTDDCLHGEDEIDCPGYCHLEQEIKTIKCVNGRDYPRRWACSGLIPECDGVCDVCDPELAFTCTDQTKRCIPRQQMCDHVKQCADGSDEAPELCACSNNDMFKCTAPAVFDSQPKCIPRLFQCDGYHDCNDGEDEANCDSCFNNPAAFYCAAKRTCFPSSSRCDGVVDCPDFSDEDNCPCHTCKSQRYETYMCATKGRCLKRDHVCNSQSIYHCPGSAPEDEMFCSGRLASNLL